MTQLGKSITRTVNPFESLTCYGIESWVDAENCLSKKWVDFKTMIKICITSLEISLERFLRVDLVKF